MIKLPTTRGGWQVIYADPSWNYSNKRTRAAAEKHYVTMKLAEMIAMPVQQIAARDCFLFMWATSPMKKVAIQLGEAWGFRYVTEAFKWAKRNKKANTPFFGMGNYTRATGEDVLLFIRGTPKVKDRGVPQFLWSPVMRHSEKPHVIRDRIVRLCGDVRRVELFSRHEVSGWSRWGNEILK